MEAQTMDIKELTKDYVIIGEEQIWFEELDI